MDWNLSCHTRKGRCRLWDAFHPNRWRRDAHRAERFVEVLHGSDRLSLQATCASCDEPKSMTATTHTQNCHCHVSSLSLASLPLAPKPCTRRRCTTAWTTIISQETVLQYVTMGSHLVFSFRRARKVYLVSNSDPQESKQVRDK